MTMIHAQEPSRSIAFSAQAQQSLYHAYGDPREAGWQERWLTRWAIREDFPWFPAGRLLLHEDLKTLLFTAFAELERKGLHREIESCEGCFGIRHVHGPYSVLSVHSWGAAIDLNSADNTAPRDFAWSTDFLDTMVSKKIFCGQLWNSCPEPGHFSMVCG
jgi:hypothetical protein